MCLHTAIEVACCAPRVGRDIVQTEGNEQDSERSYLISYSYSHPESRVRGTCSLGSLARAVSTSSLTAHASSSQQLATARLTRHDSAIEADSSPGGSSDHAR